MSTYTLTIWKIDRNHEQCTADPHATVPFDFERDDTVDYDENEQMKTTARPVILKNLPTIDCAGYQVIVTDEESREVLVFDEIY